MNSEQIEKFKSRPAAWAYVQAVYHDKKFEEESPEIWRRWMEGEWSPHRSVEDAVYGWWVDYDEWPTVWNLIDRLRNDLNLTEEQASKRITDVLNEPGSGAYVHAVTKHATALVLAQWRDPDWIHPELLDGYRFALGREVMHGCAARHWGARLQRLFKEGRSAA